MTKVAAQAFLSALGKGTVDRSTLASDFNDYLTPAKVAAAKAALNALGPISKVRVTGTSERGGLEVATILFDVGQTNARALMYRAPSGKIEEFLIARN
jgi:hypothetical protein